MRMSRLACLFFLIISSCFLSFVFAETIVFKSGQEMEGKIIEKTKDSMKINFEGVELTYPLDEVKSIDDKIVNETSTDKNTPTESTGANAALIYNEAVANLINIPEDFGAKVKDLIRDGWSDNYAYLKDILTNNQAAMTKFKEATQLQYCDFMFDKAIEKTATSAMPIPVKIFNPVQLIMIEARLWESENKYDLALNNYISILRFTQHLNQQKDFMLASNITAIVAQNVVYNPLIQYINRKDFSLQECTNLLDALLFLRKNKIGLDRAFEEEKEISKNTIRLLKVDAKWVKLFQPYENFFQEMFKEFDARADEFNKYLISAYKENNPNIYNEKINQFENKVKEELKPLNITFEAAMSDDFKVKDPSLEARILFIAGSGGDVYPKVFTRYYIALSKFNVLLAAVAVKLYEIKNGKVPDNLQMLQPEYIAELPEDPFNNFSPLKFERKDAGWVIYSLGPDRQDNYAAIIHSGKDSDVNMPGDIVFFSRK